MDIQLHRPLINSQFILPRAKDQVGLPIEVDSQAGVARQEVEVVQGVVWGEKGGVEMRLECNEAEDVECCLPTFQKNRAYRLHLNPS